jgi:hypothetical protein
MYFNPNKIENTRQEISEINGNDDQLVDYLVRIGHWWILDVFSRVI